MPYREEGPQRDRTGRGPGMARLVRRSNAMSGGTAFFSLLYKRKGGLYFAIRFLHFFLW